MTRPDHTSGSSYPVVLRALSALVAFAFLATSSPLPRAWAAPQTAAQPLDASPSSTEPQEPAQASVETTQGGVGVLSGHSWFKSWDPALEEAALKEWEAKHPKQPSSATSARPVSDASHLRREAVSNSPPQLAGLEDALTDGSRPMGRGEFIRKVSFGLLGFVVGAAVAEQVVNHWSTRQAPPQAAHAPMPVAPPASPISAVPPAPVPDAAPAAAEAIWDLMDLGLRAKVTYWQEQAQKFLEGQKIGGRDDPISALDGFNIRGFQSYKSDYPVGDPRLSP